LNCAIERINEECVVSRAFRVDDHAHVLSVEILIDLQCACFGDSHFSSIWFEVLCFGPYGVYEQAKQRGVELIVVKTPEACQLLSQADLTTTNAILHLTC
jgi:hypothetical protein